jgi:hypothetical protein
VDATFYFVTWVSVISLIQPQELRWSLPSFITLQYLLVHPWLDPDQDSNLISLSLSKIPSVAGNNQRYCWLKQDHITESTFPTWRSVKQQTNWMAKYRTLKSFFMIGFDNHEWLLTVFTPKGQFYWRNHISLVSNCDECLWPRPRSIDTIERP